MDREIPRAEALLVSGDRVAALGPRSLVETEIDRFSRRVDLEGRSVVPGFNDCHMHILPYGLDLARADLSPAAGVSSVLELVIALRHWADANPQSEWVERKSRGSKSVLNFIRFGAELFGVLKKKGLI